MNNLRERPSKALDQVVNNLLTNLLNAGVTDTARAGVTALGNIVAAYDSAANQLNTIVENRELTLEGKRSRGLQIFNPTKQAYMSARASVDEALARDTRWHEGRSAWPRTEGTTADREALMANARQDLKDLLANVNPGRRSERLAFAVRNGSPAVQELVLSEKYPERVLWPSLPEGASDAAVWAAMLPDLLEEMHPGGDTAKRSLKALEAIKTSGVKIRDVLRGIQSLDLSNLIEQAGLGVEATPGDEEEEPTE